MFTKPTYDVNNVQQLEDITLEQATLVKQTFDKTGADGKTFIELHIDELESVADGSSGMDKVGMTPINGVMTTPQQSFEYLKSRLDALTPTLNIFSVKDYGAVGDGVTDDTAAIISALNAITALGLNRGNILFFPFGEYVFSTLPTFPYGTVLRGAGREGTILRSTNNTGYCMRINKYTVFEDMTISGLGATGNGIDVDNPVRKSIFNRIAIIDFTSGTALKIDSAYDTAFYSVEILRCFKVAEITAQDNNVIAFFSCSFVDIYSEIGMDIADFTCLSFYNSSWGHIGAVDTGVAMVLSGGTQLTLINNWFEWCSKALVNNGASNINLVGNHFSTGIELNTGDNAYLAMNDFYGNGGTIENNGMTNVLSFMNANRQGFSLHTGIGKTSIGDASSISGQNPACRVTGNAQPVLNNTDTKISFNAERYDSDNMHDNITNNTRITINEKGIYDVKANVQFEVNVTGDRALRILLNDSTVIGWTSEQATNGAHRMQVSTTYNFEVGDYIELQVYQLSGTTLNIEKSNNSSPEFMATKISQL